MRAAPRLHLPFPRLPSLRAVPPLPVLVFSLALALVAGAAVASLVSLRDPGLAAIVAVAGLVGVAGSAAAYFAAAGEDVPDPEPLFEVHPRQPPFEPAPDPPRARPVAARQSGAHPPRPRPLRVQSLPVAELPPAYLAAVRKGTAANRAALKARAGRV
jgi:hypothetical protein